jgi:hypothetical protein
MPKSELRRGKTPNGGDREVVYYFNDKWQPAEKSIATKAKIVEYDGKEPIHRVYADITRKDLIDAR